MADIGVAYTLTTPDGTVVFNDGSADQFYITPDIVGLGQAPIRAPIDPVAFGHGSISHNFWEGGRDILIDGIFLIQSTRVMNSIVVIRNEMEETLRVALRSISALAVDVGTLAWTPQGQSPRLLEVRCNVPVDFVHEDNWATMSFHFGLHADVPDWDGWSS